MNKEKKIKMPKWLDVTFKIIEWAIILVIVFCMLSLLSQKMCNKTPSLFGYTTYTVLTDSMSGTYEVGDVLVCKRVKDPLNYAFSEGDVVAFIAPHGFDKDNLLEGYTVTHRIINGPYQAADGYWYIDTKGDSAPQADLVPIPLENVQGLIVGSNKFISKLMLFLSKWYGFVIVVVVPLCVILIWQIVVLFKTNTQKQEEILLQAKQKELERVKQIEKEKIENEIKENAINEYIESLKKEK